MGAAEPTKLDDVFNDMEKVWRKFPFKHTKYTVAIKKKTLEQLLLIRSRMSNHRRPIWVRALQALFSILNWAFLPGLLQILVYDDWRIYTSLYSYITIIIIIIIVPDFWPSQNFNHSRVLHTFWWFQKVDTTYELISALVAGTNEYLQPNPGILII